MEVVHFVSWALAICCFVWFVCLLLLFLSCFHATNCEGCAGNSNFRSSPRLASSRSRARLRVIGSLFCLLPIDEAASILEYTVQNPIVFLGLTEQEILRQEMVAQLCMGDRTHSQLVDLISFSVKQLISLAKRSRDKVSSGLCPCFLMSEGAYHWSELATYVGKCK